MKNKKEKTIKCSMCGTEFQGSFCHECGAPAEKDKSSKKSKAKKGCLIVFLVPFCLFTLLLIIGLSLPDTPKTEPVNNSTASAESVSTADSTTTNPTETLTEDVTEPSDALSESNTSSTENDNITSNSSTKADLSNTTTKKVQQNTSTTTTKKSSQNSTTTTTKNNPQNNTTTTTKPNNTIGKTVYVTPNGKKYHYSKDCAGKNAIAKNINDAKKSYDPCKKCVL